MTPDNGVVRANQDTYGLPAVLADARIGELPAGTNLLISGPSRTQKRKLALDLLSSGAGMEQPAILISTDSSANSVIEEFEAALEGQMPPTYVVDCTGNTDTETLPGDVHVEEVGSAGDLTGIGVALSECMRVIGDDAAGGLRIAHISLSTLLQYTSAERVFEFCHVISGRISAAGYLGVWTLNTDTHDATVVNTLRGRFEYVAEIRENDDGTLEMRVLGGEDDWRQWRAL
jgi:hypothetical protein